MSNIEMPNQDELYTLRCKNCDLRQDKPVPAEIAEWSSDFHIDKFPGHTVVCSRASDGGLHWTATKRVVVSEPNPKVPGKPGAPAAHKAGAAARKTDDIRRTVLKPLDVIAAEDYMEDFSPAESAD